MKPDWKNAPEWAQWLAKDADGRWFWFDSKPSFYHNLGEWRGGWNCRAIPADDGIECSSSLEDRQK